MKILPTRFKPASGFAHFVHLGLTLVLPLLVYALIRINFIPLAYGLVLLSKWRMFAVRPRYWPANIRANATDLLVNLSFVTFMAHTDAVSWQLFWALMYGIWQVVLKPRTSMLMISIQAFVGQTLALTSIFLAWKNVPALVIVFGVWAICYLSARHFFTIFDEPHTTLYSYYWGYFAATLVWVLSHWLLFYGFIAQPTLILSVLGLGCATLYYLGETDRLSTLLRRQFIFMMSAVLVVVLVFSDWGDKSL